MLLAGRVMWAPSRPLAAIKILKRRGKALHLQNQKVKQDSKDPVYLLLWHHRVLKQSPTEEDAR